MAIGAGRTGWSHIAEGEAHYGLAYCLRMARVGTNCNLRFDFGRRRSLSGLPVPLARGRLVLDFGSRIYRLPLCRRPDFCAAACDLHRRYFLFPLSVALAAIHFYLVWTGAEQLTLGGAALLLSISLLLASITTYGLEKPLNVALV